MDDVVQRVTASLRLPRGRRLAIDRELRSHLAEAERDLVLAGWSRAEAAAEARRRLGDPSEIAEGFRRVHGPIRRLRIGIAFSVAVLSLGAFGLSGTMASTMTSHHARQAPTHHAVHHHSHRAR
jgi:hypothetical protein